MSVSTHIMSPLSKGLFNRAILESGADLRTKTGPSPTPNEALKRAKDYAKGFKCSDDYKWLDCLRGVDANSLLHYNLSTFIDGTEFLPQITQKALKGYNYSRG